MMSIFNKVTIPAVLTNLLSYTTIIIDNIYAGQLEDPRNLAVVGLTYTTSLLMVLVPLIGVNYAQDTLANQAYGANNL